MQLQRSLMSQNCILLTYSRSSSLLTNQTWCFSLNCFYSNFLHLDLLLTLPVLSDKVRWSFASEGKRERETEKEELKLHNQNQPTTEGNNVRNGRNRYAISTYPPSRRLGSKDDREAAGVLTWKSNQIIEGKRAQHLILLSDGPCCRHWVVCMHYQGEPEVTERNTTLQCFKSLEDHEMQYHKKQKINR